MSSLKERLLKVFPAGSNGEFNLPLNPMGTKLYLSLAHDEGVCGELLNRLSDALKAVR
jgi:hypothetical protein